MASLKQSLKKILIEKQHRRYDREVDSKNLTYDSWIREQEKKINIASSICPQNKKSLTNDFGMEKFGSDKDANEGKKSKNDETCRTVKVFDQVYLYMSAEGFLRNPKEIFEDFTSDIILLSFYEGRISELAWSLLYEKFNENENIILIYGDEDIQKGMARENPWFKPDWSPDRFLAGFYLGGLVAVRTKALQETVCRGLENRFFVEYQGKESEKSLEKGRQMYLLLFEMLKKHHAFDIRDERQMPVCHIRQVLYHSRENGYEQVKCWQLPKAALKSPDETAEIGAYKALAGKAGVDRILLSVIIPSKDNPRVLFQCLDSLLGVTDTDYSYEIILVDNGSSEENRRKIAEKIKKSPQCSYLYEPMPFNFSKMCNMGAEHARGQLLLFLNDDMEIIQPDWMNLMIEKALLPYAGAVGAKLLYPDTDIIQHAGITNLRVGPAHKLQFLSDRDDHYFGMNRGVHDMLAVTGACLMVKKDVFVKAGGFYEGLAVAFNDVDLCYSVYEKGYYNIVRNDVTLYHHESLSRGKDGESEEKQLRLLREKDILYERHQDIYGTDPFYHPYLTTDMLESEYSPACRYQVTLDMPWSKVAPGGKEVKKAREDACLKVGMECAMDIYKWQYGVTYDKGKVKAEPEDMGYYFQGYSFVIGSDNACYKKTLLLKNRAGGQIWMIPADSRYRKDIKSNLKDQLNVDLTGFAAKMRKGDIPAGVYQFGMLAEDKCSRLKLVNWSNWILEVTEDGR